MKILFVSQIVPWPPHGGGLQRTFNLLREIGREHEVHLIAFHHPDELPHGEPVEQSRRVLGQFCRQLEYLPLPAKESRLGFASMVLRSLFDRKPFSTLAHRNSTLARRIDELCHGDARPDVVHLDTIGLVPYLQYCGSVPAVLTHHNIESQLMSRRAEREGSMLARAYERLQAARLLRYEREQCTRFSLNIVVSRADAALLASISPGVRTSVVPNGVDVDYFNPREGEETPALIYAGGMNMFANRDAVEWFLETTWPLIKKAVPGVRFFAIGQRPSRAILDAAAADPAVEVPGFVDDIRPWVARAAVYVVPLRVGGGTRLKIVDAMAQGKAIVATRLGAEGIEASDGEHLVLADEPPAFADAVVRLLNDPARRRALGTAARRRVCEVYAWSLLGRKLSEDYSRVVQESAKCAG